MAVQKERKKERKKERNKGKKERKKKERKKEIRKKERKKERKRKYSCHGLFVECGHEFGNRQQIRCDVCSCGVHRLCGTGKYIFFIIFYTVCKRLPCNKFIYLG